MAQVSGLLGILLAVFIAVLMGGQLFDVQQTGDDLSGAPGSFFAALPTIWILLTGFLAVGGLLAVFAIFLRR